MENQVPDPLIGQVVDERYDVLKRIATGGMATVYLALDRRLDREIALKVMHPHLAENADFVSRFRREARSAAKLAHPGVVAVHDQGQDGRVVYLAMEYVEGQTLRDLLNQLGALTLDEAFDVLSQVLEALGAAHEAGLVHRDVKPENVLVTANGTVKVADFGVARAIGDSTTSTGTVMGTVAYLSPELLTLGVADARTDVYASGILLYEMITGTQPFKGNSPIQVAYQHVHDDMPVPSLIVNWLPQEVDELITTLTARDPDNRPETAHEAGKLLAKTAPLIDPEILQKRASSSHATVPVKGVSPTATDAESTRAKKRAFPAAKARQRTQPVAEDSPAATALIAAMPLTPEPSPEPTQPRRRPSRRMMIIVASVVALSLILTGGVMTWYQNFGPGAFTAVPQLAGKTLAEATAALKTIELKTKSSEAFSTEVKPGLVISSTPAAKEQISKDGTVTLLISKGPDYREVPQLEGIAEADAKVAIESKDLVYAADEPQYSEEIAEGFVISQVPGALEQVIKGDTVRVVISKGREPFEIPNVVGQPTDTARQMLAGSGFDVKTAEDFSDTVETGKVISQSPGHGNTGFRNDVVTIIVSKGPDLVVVPDVVRSGTDKAIKTLEAAGLRYSVDNQDTFFNLVRSQEPVAGSTVKRGTVVSLRVL